VRLHICGNITPLLSLLSEVHADLVDLDSMVAVAAARRALGPHQCLCGNINPVSVLRDTTPAVVAERLEECFADAGRDMYAVAAGCEVPRDTPAANLQAMGLFARAHAPARKG
jgi:uroporphyrinogen-III decarboxylase